MFTQDPSSTRDDMYRRQVLTRLRRDGSIRPQDLEVMYGSYVLGQALGDNQHPLILAYGFELEMLGIGKWEWLLAWLAPYHPAAEFPGIMDRIAAVWLNAEPMPPEAWAVLNERLAAMRGR